MLVIGSIPIAIYTMYVSGVVTQKFEGKRWAVPARVYARSIVLYAGSPVTSDRLKSELQLLGYRQKPQADRTGTWTMNGNRMRIEKVVSPEDLGLHDEVLLEETASPDSSTAPPAAKPATPPTITPSAPAMRPTSPPVMAPRIRKIVV